MKNGGYDLGMKNHRKYHLETQKSPVLSGSLSPAWQISGLVGGQSLPCALGRGLTGREAEMLLYSETPFITVCH